MLNRILLSEVFLFLLLAPSAQAQPSDRFPESIQVTYQGETYRAFNLGNFKELLVMDAELSRALSLLSIQEQKIVNLEESYTYCIAAIKVEQDTVETLTSYSEYLFKRWEEENKLRHEAENKPRLGTILGWSTSAVFGVLSLVLITHLVF